MLLILGWAIGAYFYGAAVSTPSTNKAAWWRSSLQQGWQDRGRLLGIGAVFSCSIPALRRRPLRHVLWPHPMHRGRRALTHTPAP